MSLWSRTRVGANLACECPVNECKSGKLNKFHAAIIYMRKFFQQMALVLHSIIYYNDEISTKSSYIYIKKIMFFSPLNVAIINLYLDQSYKVKIMYK